VNDIRNLRSFSPSVASVAERGIWRLRDRVENVRIVGGTRLARLVAAAACKILGIPCTLAETFE
jgi:hypothetical protein